MKNVCIIQVWLLFGVTVTMWVHCNPDIIQCYQRQFRTQSWHDAEAYLQTNTFVLQLECKYWRTKPLYNVYVINRALTKVCCVSIFQLFLFEISHWPDGSILQADFVSSFINPFFQDFKAIFCPYFGPCSPATWIILLFYNFCFHFSMFLSNSNHCVVATSATC
jgi:hypothetical protein